MVNEELLAEIDDFERQYHYDGEYLKELLKSSEEGFKKFTRALDLTAHRELLEQDEFWVAKLASIKSLDCGSCLQLNVTKAIEQGVSKKLISAVVTSTENLPSHLEDVKKYSIALSNNQLPDEELQHRVVNHFSRGQLIELGICIATAMLFPLVKKAAGYSVTCSFINLDK